MNVTLKTLIVLCMHLTFSAAASDLFNGQKVSTKLSLGALSGQTKKRVYGIGPALSEHKDSQLNWKYRNAAIITGALDWDVVPQMTLSAEGWTTLGSRGGNMEDYDWQNYSQAHWTDRSTHPNTRLNYANAFDLSIKGWLLNDADRRFGLMAGYQQSRYSFTARGGSYNYDNGTDIGMNPRDLAVIGYKQRYNMPYLGLLGQYRYQNVEIGGAFKYSGWVHTTDKDDHYMTDFTFKSSIRNQNAYSLSLNAGYYLTEHAKIVVEGTRNRVTNKKGDRTSYNHEDGTVAHGSDDRGIENTNFITRVGVNYTF